MIVDRDSCAEFFPPHTQPPSRSAALKWPGYISILFTDDDC